MAKRLSELATYVESSVPRFELYLNEHINSDILSIIKRIDQETSVYLFSGVIRSFFLKDTEIRDIDIILEDEIDVAEYFKEFPISRNSFGGYKILLKNIKVDLWILDKSWALQYQLTLNYDLKRYIPLTAFFNFSAIIYSFRYKTFYPTNHFLRFLRDKKIDIVYQPNSNYELCVLNSIYYSEKLGLGLKPRLVRLVSSWVKNLNSDFQEVQLKHFGKILYSRGDIEKKAEEMRKQIK